MVKKTKQWINGYAQITKQTKKAKIIIKIT